MASITAPGKDRQNSKLPPVLPLSWIETAWRLSLKDDLPWFMLRWARDIGFVYRMRTPDRTRLIVVGDADLAREILEEPSSIKPRVTYEKFDVIVGASNMFAANGERWRHARKSIAPAFSSAKVKGMQQICNHLLEDWIQRRLNVFCDREQAFDPAREMAFLALTIILKAGFEYDMEAEEADFFLRELDLTFQEFFLKQNDDPLRATWLGYIYAFADIRRAEQAKRNMAAVAQKILDSYRNNSTSLSSSKGTIIELIVKNQNYKDDRERIADILVFLVAGHDTISNSIAWTLLELARHRDDVENARHELESLASEEERLKSPALNNLIKEAMRLHPVVALGVIREAKREFRVDDNTVIPIGSLVWIPQLLLHRNPKHFEQPDNFLPDRWYTVRDRDRAFMPFLAGARNCVGQPLATAELTSIIARLVAEYELDIVSPGEPKMAFNMRLFGALLKARRRSTQTPAPN